MIICISTILDAPADRAWGTVKRTTTFLFVTRGVLGLRDARRLPEEWSAGYQLRTRLLLFQFVPAWLHSLRVISVDDTARELYTNEYGGPIRIWNHRIIVRPASINRCSYTDEIEIGTGIGMPLRWLLT